MSGHLTERALDAAAAVHRLAARTFVAEVDPPFYQALLDLGRAPALGGLGRSPIDERLRAEPEPQALAALAVEYCRLFVGPRPACPPYASAWARGTTGLPARQAIRTCLAELGIEPRLPPGAPVADEDHAAIALAVLAELCGMAAASGTSERRREAIAAYVRFRDDCLRPWLPGFLSEVEHNSHCGPYRFVARVTALALDGGLVPDRGGG